MKGILYIPAMAAFAALLATPAMAGDGGWYAGLNLGGTIGAFQSASNAVTPGGVGGNVSGGVQAGYEWPGSDYVAGVEADLDGISVPAHSAFSKFGERWSSTVRARFGVPYSGCMPFVSLGVGFTDVRQTLIGFGSHTDVRTGVAAGAGVDLPPIAGWTVRFEYLYVEVPKKATSIVSVPFNGGSDNSTLRVAINYPL